MSASARLKYKIVKCTSEDPDYPVSELMAHSQQTKGWQTAKFCEYPQELGLQFEMPVHLRQVQFLSHQSKIATKIELFTALPGENQKCRYESAQFKRLGYLSLDNNERSQFQARELKSVYVDATAQFLRILLHKCHLNRFNVVSQVGLIALNCLGEALALDTPGPPSSIPPQVKGSEPPPPSSRRESGFAGKTSAPQSVSAPATAVVQPAPAVTPPSTTSQPPTGSSQTSEAEASDGFDAQTLERIQSLEKAKQRAVEVEDYEEAKKCKEMLNRLRQTGSLLKELEERKRAAVQNEDYDAAKGLKVEIDRLRMQIEGRQAPPPPPVGGCSVSDAGPPRSVPHDASREQEWPPAPSPSAQRGQPGIAESPSIRSNGDNSMSGKRPTSQSKLSPSEPKREGFGNGTHTAPTFGGTSSPHPEDVAAPNPSPAASPGRGFKRNSAQSGGRGSMESGDRGSVENGLVSREGGSVEGEGQQWRGAPNLEELGPPDPLAANVAQEAEPLQALFGDHLTLCVYSKAWNLRERALQKLAYDVREGTYHREDPNGLLHGLATILKRAIPDKNVQVYLASAALQQAFCQTFLERGSLRRQEVQSALDAVFPLLVERLGDANPRVEKTTKDAFIEFARCQAVGAQFTSQHLLRPPKKKSVHHRVYSSRLQLLAMLAGEVGVQSESRDGIPLEPTVQLAMEWFSNPNAEVRESAVKLVAACYAHVGLQKIEKHLANLRPAQREVFDVEFEKVSHSPSGVGIGAVEHARMETSASGSFDGMSRSQVPPTRKTAAPPPAASNTDEYEIEDGDFVCQFCGRYDPMFTQDGLDVHYWRECPVLIECDVCQQVIEISSLRDHLREECERGAVARSAARDMQPNQCPLCRTDVGRGEEADWLHHLLRAGCQWNPRDKHRSLACLDNLRRT